MGLETILTYAFQTLTSCFQGRTSCASVVHVRVRRYLIVQKFKLVHGQFMNEKSVAFECRNMSQICTL